MSNFEVAPIVTGCGFRLLAFELLNSEPQRPNPSSFKIHYSIFFILYGFLNFEVVPIVTGCGFRLLAFELQNSEPQRPNPSSFKIHYSIFVILHGFFEFRMMNTECRNKNCHYINCLIHRLERDGEFDPCPAFIFLRQVGYL